MSLKVTFDECKSSSTSDDSDTSRKPSNASTSSRKERLCRATSTCTVRCPALATPVRRWLSTADMVCDQEFLDLINGILPMDHDDQSSQFSFGWKRLVPIVIIQNCHLFFR
ncbi:hypothetical protein T4E_4866 [Trichinella pseudospiralis]|uniref:Uncharacterized protein n=1 Tax=Trichinella pseudospiralis TaxID=6337 RepID=A0A0V0XNN4_TRIPS|nr:hypothetical protein T4E_4866 [Trichinella pseudospiralis]